MSHYSFLFTLLFLLFHSCTKKDLASAGDFLGIGDFLQARKIYRKVVERSPRNFEARFGIALSYYQEAAYKASHKTATLKDWETVVYHLKLASNINETENLKRNLAGAYYNLGIYYRQNTNYPAALSQFQQAVIYDSTLVEAFNQLGALYQRKGKNKMAEIAYTRALHKKPDHAAVYFNLGSLYWSMGKFEKVKQSWQRAVALDSGNVNYQAWLKKVLRKLDKP